MPGLFTDPTALAGAALVGGLLAIAALQGEDRWRPTEQRVAAPLAAIAAGMGLLAVRIGLALMLALGAMGGLPRAGTRPWTEPVLFVPDMQLALAPGWSWLAPVAYGVAILLAMGVFTRLAAFGVIGLSALGLGIFGQPFLSYAMHFAGPALLLIGFGPGWLAVDAILRLHRRIAIGPMRVTWIWRAALAMIGGTFVYLGIVHKLLQPTLLIAILNHGRFPTFGLPIELIALIMTVVEITAGLLLALGRLVRPVAVFLIGAFSFFALMLGETPLFHANLYGVALLFLLAGQAPPTAPLPWRMPRAGMA
ncbi:MAG: hypothetical protein AAFR17_05180 [Pseudomonadota bacterium]